MKVPHLNEKRYILQWAYAIRPYSFLKQLLTASVSALLNLTNTHRLLPAGFPFPPFPATIPESSRWFLLL